MSAQRSRWTAVFILTCALAAPAAPQSTSPPPPDPAGTSTTPAGEQGHGIDSVDAAPPGAIIAIPLPQQQRRKMKKYDVPELAGARQALGSQLINGQLPHPLIDYCVTNRSIEQRISFFEGGLVVVAMDGAGGTMRKKLIVAPDTLAAYYKAVSADVLANVKSDDVTPPTPDRRSRLRIYRADGSKVEVAFDPLGVVPKPLNDEVRPLEDLLRVISEDRTVTNTIAGYYPKVGDVLVGDDRKTWRVERVLEDSGTIVLHGVNEPTVIYVDRKDLYNYFIGKRASAD